MALILREIAFDCLDAPAQARFWGEVLGWKPQKDDGESWWWMSESGDEDDPGLLLVFQPGGAMKTSKNRVHIDVSPRGADQAAEVDRLLALGATRVDVGQGSDVSWVVLADPEGNELCVLHGPAG